MKLFFPVFLFVFFCSVTLIAQTAEQPNILFVISDDLNDYVNTLNDSHPQTSTPNIAALANLGTNFQNAFCNAPLCAPSRTSFITGKLPDYTGVTINGGFDCTDFNNNITPGHYIMPLPEYLKDSAGYYTYNLGKFYHCNAKEFDEVTEDPCARGKSWNQYYNLGTNTISDAGQENPEGIDEIKWSAVDSNLVSYMDDYMAADSILAFFDRYNSDPSEFCDRPFFIAYGIKKPHSNLYIPEQYFMDYYVDDFYDMPYVIPYNDPPNAYPYNGFVMAPQPEIPYSDFDMLADLAKDQMPLAPYNEFNNWWVFEPSIPEVDPSLTEEERNEILTKSKMANGTMAYMAAVKFVDEQFGRVMTALAKKPELYNNTIVIFTSDHGFAWGEKKHFGKAQLWETDIRIPLIIADLRSPVANVSSRAVSLIDLYPTICELAGIDPPKFPDGSHYLDGQSLLPLMQQPELQIETPVLTQISNSVDGLICWPQSSIRNERFHYVRFLSTGPVGTIDCDSAGAYVDRNLYEIGSNRNLDKNEWNNLGKLPEYEPLMDYFDKFLPGGELFNQKVYKAVIVSKTVKCLYKINDSITLKARLYDTLGNIVAGSELSNFTFTWSNSITDDIYTGANLLFPMSTLSDEQFTSNEKILFYLHVTDNATGKLIAFEIQSVFINPANKPNAVFNVELDGFSASIVDYNINGTYTTTSWNFGDGVLLNDFVPATHTYPGEGTYIIRNTINYGNSCKRTIKKNVTISMLEKAYNSNTGINLKVYPIPANNIITLDFDKGLINCEVRIFNLQGQLVQSNYFDGVSNNKIILNISSLPEGVYNLELRGVGFLENRLIEVY